MPNRIHTLTRARARTHTQNHTHTHVTYTCTRGTNFGRVAHTLHTRKQTPDRKHTGRTLCICSPSRERRRRPSLTGGAPHAPRHSRRLRITQAPHTTRHTHDIYAAKKGTVVIWLGHCRRASRCQQSRPDVHVSQPPPLPPASLHSRHHLFTADDGPTDH